VIGQIFDKGTSDFDIIDFFLHFKKKEQTKRKAAMNEYMGNARDYGRSKYAVDKGNDVAL
jgi:hypothetical protein